MLALFPLYFDAVRYWEDQDSGHWEEIRKVEASSIGVVTAGLKELKKVLTTHTAANICRYDGSLVTPQFVDTLVVKGLVSLNKILPSECIQKGLERHYDSALLFLIFPINIVSEEMSDYILCNVINNLQGSYGILRYQGDAFWSPDFKDNFTEQERTTDYSNGLSQREKLLMLGGEAQWCIFDPIISLIYGIKYQTHRNEEFLKKQTYYFNRSLGQLTGSDCKFGEFKCPELYYLEKGKRVPNDTTPLLWTQANLWLSFKYMELSLELAEKV